MLAAVTATVGPKVLPVHSVPTVIEVLDGVGIPSRSAADERDRRRGCEDYFGSLGPMALSLHHFFGQYLDQEHLPLSLSGGVVSQHCPSLNLLGYRERSPTKEDLMADTTGSDKAGSDETSSGHDTLEQLGRALDAWRSRIDELLVQLDLAAMDAREDIRSRIDGAENAYLAARSRLSDARADAGSNLASARQGVESLLSDLQQAYDSAVEALRRGSGGGR